MIYTDNAKCGKKILYSNCEISLDYPKRYSENVDVKQVTTERKKKKFKKHTTNSHLNPRHEKQNVLLGQSTLASNKVLTAA